MAVFKCIKIKNYNLGELLKYVTRVDKTKDELIYAKDCSIETAKYEFEFVKKMYSKKDRRQYYHFVQSFSPDDNITPRLAHQVGKEMLKCFDGFQVVMGTHIDKGHLHNHFVINSVSYKNGLKYHQSKKDLENIKLLSNEICKKYNLKIIRIESGKCSKYMEKNEFHIASKTETQKQELIKVINKCIKSSKSKEQFIFKMNELGYKVKWQDTRKYITYTTPNDMKFRDKRLQNIKYTKEKMESYFDRLNKRNRLKNAIIKASLINVNTRHNVESKSNIEEYSDLAKKDYMKKNENASSIEWEE